MHTFPHDFIALLHRLNIDALSAPWSKVQQRLALAKKLLSVKWESFCHVRLFMTPGTIAHQAPLSREFSRQEYWSGLPFPSPGDLPDLGIKTKSPAFQADSLLSEPDVQKNNSLLTHSIMYHSNQSRKRNKRNPNWKRRSKTLTICRWHDPLHRKP